MPDYAKLIDAETWAFIRHTDSFYPPDTAEKPIAEQRAVYDRMCREFFAGYPRGVSAGTGTIAEAGGHPVRARAYRRESPDEAAVVLYFHGGGFVVGGLESHDDVCAEICARTGFDVVSVDYRLSPEHRHPAAFHDALAAFRFLLTRPKPVLLCGDSAGGNLAAAVAHAARRETAQPAGQVLVYPGLGGTMGAGSFLEHAEAPMLTTRDVLFYRDIRAAGPQDLADPTAAPLADTDFSGLPPTVLVTAQCDPLSSDGEAYRDRILAAGGKAWWHEEPGLVHGFLRARHSAARAKASFSRVVAALSALGQARPPW